MTDTCEARADAKDFELRGKKVWVAGHRGLVGSALCRRLRREACEIVTIGRDRLDLCRQSAVEAWVREVRPDVILLAAAHVGGILANMTRPAEFIYDNVMIAANVIEAARRFSAQKLLYLGSSCVYPRDAPQPISERALLTGPLESTNEAYAVAKIAGLKVTQAYAVQYGHDFITAMPTNLYGPGDNFDPDSAHVIPALMRKIHEAKQGGRRTVQIWGSGAPRREFLHVDDLADACVFLLERYSSPEIVNVGAGFDVTILELAGILADVIGYEGTFTFDPTKPDGTPRKLLDTSRLRRLGWRPRIGLRDGLARTYRACWLSEQEAVARPVSRRERRVAAWG